MVLVLKSYRIPRITKHHIKLEEVLIYLIFYQVSQLWYKKSIQKSDYFRLLHHNVKALPELGIPRHSMQLDFLNSVRIQKIVFRYLLEVRECRCMAGCTKTETSTLKVFIKYKWILFSIKYLFNDFNCTWPLYLCTFDIYLYYSFDIIICYICPWFRGWWIYIIVVICNDLFLWSNLFCE